MQSSILGFIHQHPAACLLGAYYVVSNAIAALPMPKPTSGAFYVWFFQFSQGVGANIARLLAARGIGNGNAPQQASPKV